MHRDRKFAKSVTFTSSRIRSLARKIEHEKEKKATEKRKSKFQLLQQKSVKKSIIKYQIAIPSYQRTDIIQKKTLALLNHHKIDPSLITIFVANAEEYAIYKDKIPSHLYGKIVIGEKGLKNQRNFISRHYPEGTFVVEFDDDLSKIVQLVIGSGVHKHIKPIDDLDAFIKKAFKFCYVNDIYLWGVYPIANARFMTDTITTDLRFIVGPMWGMINRHRSDLELSIDEKENSERTLQYWTADQAVLRFNNVAIETAYYKNKGGMQSEGKNRREEALKSAQYLHNKYPSITKIYLGKKSGVPEVRLLRTKKKNM